MVNISIPVVRHALPAGDQPTCSCIHTKRTIKEMDTKIRSSIIKNFFSSVGLR